MDVVLAVVAIVLTTPLWLFVGIALRLTSTDPILYAGRRVGRDGRIFLMYKFRSMRTASGTSGPSITGAGDSRITRMGRVLRKTKVDELPQLLNVVRGDMSLVGPRPEAPEFVSLEDPRQREVLTVRPGITGPSQLTYRHEERFLDRQRVEDQYRTEILPRKIESDLQYVRTRSLWGDVRLMAATLKRLIR